MGLVTKAVTALLRGLGIRLIIYIHDMLFMAELETLLRDHIAGTVYLLENLGFVINFPKSVLEPQRTIEFLGFHVDSTSMELKLPRNKMKNRCEEASENVTALELSRILGKQQRRQLPLFYRQLQAKLQ